MISKRSHFKILLEIITIVFESSSVKCILNKHLPSSFSLCVFFFLHDSTHYLQRTTFHSYKCNREFEKFHVYFHSFVRIINLISLFQHAQSKRIENSTRKMENNHFVSQKNIESVFPVVGTLFRGKHDR